MYNLLFSVIHSHIDSDVSIGHHDGHRVAGARSPISVNPDLVSNLQVTFQLSEWCLLDCLYSIFQEFMQGGYLLLLEPSYKTFLFFVQAMFFFNKNVFVTIEKPKASTKLHLIMGFKTRPNRCEVSVFSFDHAGRTWKEPLNSFLMHQTDQDVIKHLYGVEMLKILCRLPCLEIDANTLKEYKCICVGVAGFE